MIVTLSATIPSLTPPSCDGNSCQPATALQTFVFFSGLYVIAFGTGGIRAALLPFGADQFNEENPIEMRKKVSFFSLFYVCSMSGLLISGTLIVWIQANVSWAIGFGISTFCMALASGGFLLGTSTYKLMMPTGSPLKSLLQVIVATVRKMRVEIPTEPNLLYVVNQEKSNKRRLAHTDEFRYYVGRFCIWIRKSFNQLSNKSMHSLKYHIVSFSITIQRNYQLSKGILPMSSLRLLPYFCIMRKYMDTYL